MRSLLLGAIALGGLTAVAAAQAPSVSDTDFAAKASAGNTFEIEEAKLAVDMATDQRLKDFAKTMIADHGDAEKKLLDAAGKANQKPAPGLDKAHQAMLDNLKSFSGKDFDKIYAADQIAAHDETVALLSDYIQNGDNRDLKGWAKEALPIVEHHKAMIDAM